VPPEPLRILLRCPACSWCEEGDANMLTQRLRQIGMFKRNSDVTPLEVRELVLAAASRMTCPGCGRIGLLASDALDDDQLWPRARCCGVCGVPIPAERLEVFPNAATCVACQNADEHGRLPEESEYCRKCGALLVIRQTRSQGITRYTKTCSASPPCRL
jgi:hypothetical protein